LPGTKTLAYINYSCKKLCSLGLWNQIHGNFLSVIYYSFEK
jgi:hypothetical protein